LDSPTFRPKSFHHGLVKDSALRSSSVRASWICALDFKTSMHIMDSWMYPEREPRESE
jgi:hypothetical protein